MVTAMGRGTNNNQLKAIRGSKRNGCGGGSGDGGEGNVNNNSNQDGNSDSNDANPDSLRTPPKSIDHGSFKLCGSPSWASFFVCNYCCLTFCSCLPATSKIMFPPPQKNDTTHIPTSPARIENTRYSFTS
jgi:hypothetical protein